MARTSTTTNTSRASTAKRRWLPCAWAFHRTTRCRAKTCGLNAARAAQEAIAEVAVAHSDLAQIHLLRIAASLKLPVHVDNIAASASLMKIVDVLCDEGEVVQTVRQLCQSLVGGVRFHLVELASARLIEPPHQSRVGSPSLGCTSSSR